MHDRTALDHEKRIRALERFKWILLGVVVATSTLSGIVTALISAKL
jgi:hypothetical protein